MRELPMLFLNGITSRLWRPHLTKSHRHIGGRHKSLTISLHKRHRGATEDTPDVIALHIALAE